MKLLGILINLLLLFTIFSFQSQSQNIVYAEYFLNTDPGFGNGNQISFTSGSDIPNINLSVDFSGENDGFNVLYIRAKDQNNTWSITNVKSFYKESLPTLSNIVFAEYFMDNDPGKTNGSIISLISGTNLSSVSFIIDIDTLSLGFHNLFLRTKDQNNTWSITNVKSFYKESLPTLSNIVFAEYFIDNDPGKGSGNVISLSSGTNLSSVSFIIDIDTLSLGFHNLFLRTKDQNNKWSITNAKSFYKENIPSISNIVKAEYYFDLDPGFNQGIDIPIAAATNIMNHSFVADISHLSAGHHKMAVRCKDANNRWSESSIKDIYVDLIDSLNGKTLGNSNGITYAISTASQGAVFDLNQESRIEYPFDTHLPHEGSIEFLINISSGYSYSDSTLSSNNPSATIFNTGSQDVWYLGAMWLNVNNSGTISLTTALSSTPTSHTLTATNTAFRFNEWHSVGFSYGSGGQFLMVDGQIIDSNLTYTETLQACGDQGSTRNIPALGEVTSVLWDNNRYDMGFEGVVDCFRASYSQKSFILFPPQDTLFSLNNPINNDTISTDTVQFKWSSISGARYELYVDDKIDFSSPEISKQSIDTFNNYLNTSYTICGNWFSEGKYYWKVKAYLGTDSAISSVDSFYYSPPDTTSPIWVPLYRAYYPVDADHFYCASESHLQTAINDNYRFEGVEGYIALHPFQVSGTDTIKPIYRFYIPDLTHVKGKSHYYTCSVSDRNNRITQGWIFEGITGYGLNQSHDNLGKLHHTYLDQSSPYVIKDNFYTTSEIEKNNSISSYGFTDQGFVCYVSLTGDNSTMSWLPGNIAVGSGVNPYNGNFGNMTANIFSMPEGKVSLSYGHSYNSYSVKLFKTSDPLGVGRNHTYNISLVKTEDNVFVLWGDEVHLYNGQSLARQTPGVYDSLTYINSTRYQIRKKDQTVFIFDKLSIGTTANIYWLTSVTDRNGNTISLEYDSKGRLKWAKSPANRYITFAYYSDSDTARSGLVRYVKDSLALNRQVEYIYDNERNLIEFIDVMGKSTTFTYDTLFPNDHLLESITYSDGTIITNAYNSTTKAIESQNFNSNNNSNTTSISIPSPNTRRVTDELNVQTDLEYNTRGNIISLITAKGNASFEYNDSVINPMKPTKITDGMGYITTASYNNMGDPLQINKPYGITHKYTWNSTNDILTYINPKNKTTYFTYTSGNLTAIQSPFGSGSSVTTNMTYFSNGNIQTITNPLNQITTFTYDSKNNLKTISDNLSHTTTYDYDAASRVISVTDANNHITSYGYFTNDQLNYEVDPLNNTTTYAYDDSYRLKTVTDAKSHTTSMTYDPYTGLIDHATDQLNNSTYYTYYDNGLLKTKKDRKNQTINYGYDDANRLTSFTGPTISRSYIYNLNDLITQITDNNGNMYFVYDSLSRMTSNTDFYGNQVQYIYDVANNITSIIYPGNKTVSYTYYDDNSLHTVTDWLSHTTSYLYNSDGSISRVDNPNGTYTTYAYDGAGRLIGLQNKKSDNSNINYYNYTLDNIGNHITVGSYEPYNMAIPDSSQDGANNSTSYNNANHIQTGFSSTYTNDLNGNMVEKINSAGTTNFTFNEENKLTGTSGVFSASYTYDAMGNRRASIIEGVSKRYILDIAGSMANVLIETNTSNAAQYYYIYGNGMLYRIKASDNSVQYYHYDSRGSTIAITDDNETVTHKYAYNVYGQVTNSLELDFNPFRYVGKYGVMYDDSALYFMRARYYNPDLGRFISEDPIWNVNLYAYAGNNSVNNIDPVGLTDINSKEIQRIQRNNELRQRQMELIQERDQIDQRDIKLEQWLIIAEGIESISSFAFTALGGGPALGYVQNGLKIGYGIKANNEEMVKDAIIDIVIGEIAGEIGSYCASDLASGLDMRFKINKGAVRATKHGIAKITGLILNKFK